MHTWVQNDDILSIHLDGTYWLIYRLINKKKYYKYLYKNDQYYSIN